MSVACGAGFTIVVTEQGDAWACGRNNFGQLSLGSQAHQLLPAHVGGREVFAGEPLVMMAAGSMHTAGVTKDGGAVELGPARFRPAGARRQGVEIVAGTAGREMFGGSPAVMVACGDFHMLVLTAAGLVWSCGEGVFGQLGHGDTATHLVLTLVAAERLGGALIVMVAAGKYHSVALEAEGRVWTW
eukprot:CAMPEP_0179433186 /NCGR_PEP_ID=MMETSP0799-20121207/17636_1 /TAXON_ID=46947 /ORGANISM="Geminigera cryophila, Strain CCMP2564" /LENGTH=185 /DNA_ID=CAMNT_0021210985 /DNA_START=1439 /DNA_END=1993 /DNA_ORIENTATION=+